MSSENEIAAVLKTLQTKPLELREVASIFDIGTRHVSEFVAKIPGVVRIGRRVRIPLCQCPAEYLLDIGVLNSAKLSESLQLLRLQHVAELQAHRITGGGDTHEPIDPNFDSNCSSQSAQHLAP